MIFKASKRSGGRQLGSHLLKTEENEHVEIHEVSGFISDTVMGAMNEAYAAARGTKCKQYLFSMSLSPPAHESVRVEVFEKVISDIEERLGLTGQPRVIVFHEKEGRRHCHAVWSRINAETIPIRLTHTAATHRMPRSRRCTVSSNLVAPHDSEVLRGRIRSLIETELGRELDAAYLYGSRARGDARPDSDWDVLVMLHDDADWPKARAKMRRLTGQLAEEVNERVSILPLRWSDADEHAGLLTNVAREGQRL